MSANSENADEAVTRWVHQPGDRYQVIFTELVGNWELARWLVGFEHESISAATKLGFRERGSDDFNIGAIRDGRLAAVLWMDEIVDDGIDVLDEVAVATGLGRPLDNDRTETPPDPSVNGG